MPSGYGALLRALRQQKNWSQAVLAKKVGVSRDTIARAEQSANLRIFSLYDIVAALGVPIGALFAAPVGTKQEAEFVRLWRGLGSDAREHVLDVLYRFAHEEPPAKEK